MLLIVFIHHFPGGWIVDAWCKIFATTPITLVLTASLLIISSMLSWISFSAHGFRTLQKIFINGTESVRRASNQYTDGIEIFM
jgi:hypothetical protein